MEKLCKREFLNIIRKHMSNPHVRLMSKFIQHGRTSTLNHCRRVAWISYWLNRRLRLNANEEVMLTAALLHDMCLYDWHEKKAGHTWHGFTHARLASDNARKFCNVGEREQAVILSHMWPLNIFRPPSSREAAIVCVADKLCALWEIVR